MLSNEQRAHDLALLIVQYRLSPDAIKAEAMSKAGETMDIHIEEIYFMAYDSALRAMKKHFGDPVSV